MAAAVMQEPSGIFTALKEETWKLEEEFRKSEEQRMAEQPKYVTSFVFYYLLIVDNIRFMNICPKKKFMNINVEKNQSN